MEFVFDISINFLKQKGHGVELRICQISLVNFALHRFLTHAYWTYRTTTKTFQYCEPLTTEHHMFPHLNNLLYKSYVWGYRSATGHQLIKRGYNPQAAAISSLCSNMTRTRNQTQNDPDSKYCVNEPEFQFQIVDQNKQTK